jgi:hypothetical protein
MLRLRQILRATKCEKLSEKLYIRAVKKELLLVLLFHEPLYFRYLHTIRLPRGQGVRQRFSIKLTMFYSESVIS